MKVGSNLVKHWAKVKVLSRVVSSTSIIKILSTRLLIHSTTLLPHYGSLWGICQSLYFHPVAFTVITSSEQ